MKLVLIVAGGRTFRDYALMARMLDHLTQHYDEVEVVSGTAKGVSTIARSFR